MKNKKTIFETQTIVTENIEKTIWDYYLFSALYSLKTGEIAEIENHGMFLCKDYENTGYISECRMKGQNPAKGALSVFQKSYLM